MSKILNCPSTKILYFSVTQNITKNSMKNLLILNNTLKWTLSSSMKKTKSKKKLSKRNNLLFLNPSHPNSHPLFSLELIFHLTRKPNLLIQEFSLLLINLIKEKLHSSSLTSLNRILISSTT